MVGTLRTILAASAFAIAATPSFALVFPEPPARSHWECVPFARALSGIEIYGDAWSWWDQADGRYRRGHRPKVGAVLAFAPHGGMQLGHVAVVSEVIDARTITVTHANWSPINGVRGQVERDVEVRDVSEDGDWSAVRVWYAPLGDLGTTAWPINGFIYPVGLAAHQNAAPAAAENGASPSKPTGRLNYLRRLLPKLGQASASGQ
jgi:surface antigen